MSFAPKDEKCKAKFISLTRGDMNSVIRPFSHQRTRGKFDKKKYRENQHILYNRFVKFFTGGNHEQGK